MGFLTMSALVVLSLALLAAHVAHLIDRLPEKVLPADTPGCVLDDSVLATEDLQEYRPGVLVGGAGSTLDAFAHGAENAPAGYLVAVDVRSGKPEVSRLTVLGLPAHVRFQPHGLFLSQRTQRLYAVSHGGVSGVGTRVEMFSIKEGKDGLPVFTWEMAIGGGHHFGNCVLNSVVEGQGDEIYVTQWQNTAVPAAGDENPSTVGEVAGRLANLAITIGAVVGNTGVHQCTFDLASKSTIRCRWVSYGYVHANGITINKARDTLYVADPIRRKVHVLARDAASGDLSELKDRTWKLPHAADNLHMDERTGEIHVGTIPRVDHVLFKSPLVAGGMLTAKPDDREATGFKVEEVVMHGGSKLSQVSTCLPVTDPKSNKSWNVCGSPISKGLLICPA